MIFFIVLLSIETIIGVVETILLMKEYFNFDEWRIILSWKLKVLLLSSCGNVAATLTNCSTHIWRVMIKKGVKFGTFINFQLLPEATLIKTFLKKRIHGTTGTTGTTYRYYGYYRYHGYYRYNTTGTTGTTGTILVSQLWHSERISTKIIVCRPTGKW